MFRSVLIVLLYSPGKASMVRSAYNKASLSSSGWLDRYPKISEACVQHFVQRKIVQKLSQSHYSSTPSCRSYTTYHNLLCQKLYLNVFDILQSSEYSCFNLKWISARMQTSSMHCSRMTAFAVIYVICHACI